MQPVWKWMTGGALGAVAAFGAFALPASAGSNTTTTTVYVPATAATTTPTTAVTPTTATAAATTTTIRATSTTVLVAVTIDDDDEDEDDDEGADADGAVGAVTIAAGTLPVTGSDPSATVYVAVGLIVAGGSAVALTRRRKRPAST